MATKTKKAKPATKTKKAKPAAKSKAKPAKSRSATKPKQVTKSKPASKSKPATSKSAAKSTPKPKATKSAPVTSSPDSPVAASSPLPHSAASSEYPFLYLEHGVLSLDAIGKASGAYIAFRSPVPPSARAEVMRGCPEPIGGMWSWGPTLASCESLGDVFDWLLADRYADGNPDSITAESVAAFAADVERWARGVHEMFPILFFLGPVHAEEPSPWGEYSARALPAVIVPFLEQYADANADALAGDDDDGDEDPTAGTFNLTAMSCILQHVPETTDRDLSARTQALSDRFPL